MSKEIYISSTPHETRLAIVEDEALTEIYYERENEYTLAGSIYNGRVTRVLPGMQSSFVDIGLDRDAFLYITDFMEEEPDSEEFDISSNGDRTPRTLNGERGDASSRGSRGERPGRGRRGGHEERSSPDRTAIAAPDSASAPREGVDNAELGEGAPAADPNRRWRGRRGRRRGRSLHGSAGSQSDSAGSPYHAPSGLPEDNPDFDPESYRPDPVAEARTESIEDPAHDNLARGDNPARGERARDQGRRNDSGRGREGRRFDARREDRRPEPRAPRGFNPSRNLYGVDNDENAGTGPIPNAYVESCPASEPVMLPGESLSKYRKTDQPAPAATAPASIAAQVNLAPPANLYTLAEGWDGGEVLPGETLSRHRPAPYEARRPARDLDAALRSDARAALRSRASSPVAAPATGEPHAAVAGPAPVLPVAPEAQPVAPHTLDEEPGALQTLASAAAPEAVPADHSLPEPDADYEPVDASASHRVDPIARSEYRQNGTVEAPVQEASPAGEERLPILASIPLAEPSVSESTHSPGPAPESTAEPETHDITSISSAGEMLSAPSEVLPEPIPHPAPIETPEPASPIRHEGAVVSAEAEPAFPAAPSVGAFAPGSGNLDEEFLEYDDNEAPALQASSVEELDDLEEETLEGAADLGTMLREMSIDHITGTEVEDEDDEEDDDLDEEDLDEDEEEEDGYNEERYQLEERSQLDRGAGSADELAARTGEAEDAELLEEHFGQPSGNETPAASVPVRDRGFGRESGRESDRRGRRDGRRGRGRERGGRSGYGNGHARSMQSTNLPIISDLLKPGQEILVQIAKEPIAKKGARITSHIALPGRFLVFMPTVNHTGVSRKIESDAERRRLKEILLSEKGDASGGFIVRTAAEGAGEDELRSDLRFLLNLWADIKARSESSKSPALIYHDLSLVERILRDQVTDTFSAIWVDTEDAYERVLRFLQRFQPSLIRRVKLYLKETPLFEQFGISEEINKALRSKVWLKSGGSIVINQTEALVAIDINTGKFVGKTARLEDTIVKTNLDAIPEIVRQIRLRDLGGIIIIDFIDMDERKNRNRVMAALEDELKSDRAPSKVLQFNDFGLVAITRKRVKQSLERTLSTTCSICTGTGMVKSPVTVCNDIYVEMRKMHKHLDRGDVMLRVHPEVVKQLKSSGAKWLQEMEEMVGKTILVKSDPSLHPEQFDIH